MYSELVTQKAFSQNYPLGLILPFNFQEATLVQCLQTCSNIPASTDAKVCTMPRKKGKSSVILASAFLIPSKPQIRVLLQIQAFFVLFVQFDQKTKVQDQGFARSADGSPGADVKIG